MIALTIMNIMAITIGVFIPILVYKELIEWIAIIAFTTFGVLSIINRLKMDNETLANETEEAENKIENKYKLKEKKRIVY